MNRFLAALSAAGSLPAFAIDLQPGELIPQTPGTQVVQLTRGESERGERYVRGFRQAGDPRIDTELSQIRYAQYSTVLQKPAVFYVQTAFGSVKPQGSLQAQASDSGAIDATFLAAAWPYANHEARSYLAVGAYLTLPTGSYDHRRIFNLGENRERFALQLAWQSPLAGRVDWMTAFDVTWYAANPEFGPTRVRLEQDALRTVQFGLSYPLTESVGVAVNIMHTYGGDTRLNGIAQNDRSKLNRYLLTATWRLPARSGALALQSGRDLDTENGYIEKRRLIVRYVKAF